jgi:hypothetical protein
MAMRALFLAELSHLARRELIVLARYKSNRDYHGELRRRRPDQSSLHRAFGNSLHYFEQVWYGCHAPDSEALSRVQQDFELIHAI